MKKALFKDTFREIKGSFGRFFAIFAIVFLGVAFYSGIKATGPDMRITGDEYFDATNFMDIRLLSTFGFNEKDVEAIKETPGVDGIFPAYSMDTLVSVQGKEEVIKAFSLPLDKLANPDESFINRPTLVEGRFPEASNEVVVERGTLISSELSIGSVITMKSGTDTDITESLKETEYKIVGVIEHPYYISFERGTSSIGNGRISAYIMIPQDNFKSEYYTEIYVTSEAAKRAATYDDEYDKVVDDLKDKLEKVALSREEGRHNEIIAEAREDLEDAKKELQEGEATFNKEIADGEKDLKKGEKELSQGRNTLKQQRADYEKQMAEAERQIADGYKQLEAGETEYNKNYKDFQSQKAQGEKDLQEGENALNQQEALYSQNIEVLNNLKYQLDNDNTLTPEEKAALTGQIAALELQLPMMRQGLDSAWQEFNSKKQEAEAKFSEGEAALGSARNQLDSSRRELVASEAKLQEGKAKAQEEFAAAERKLQQGEEEIREGWRKLNEAKEEGIQKLSDGREEITKAEEDIEAIEMPEWYVLGRDTNYGYMEYGAAAERMDAIGRVFPVFFFLIAALVALTTMTRMVDEQRINIGTYKALGYSKGRVAFKYVIYAILASSLGAILGVLIGFQLFPRIVFNAFRIMYTLPDFNPAFHVGIALLSVFIAISVTVLSTVFACIKELTADPSTLMRPKAPKVGKRILLERITFLWSRLSFIQKVTFRNIFRYKKRFLMTVIGIGGCTALMLVGFGVKDSVSNIVGLQYNEIYRYDAVINTDVSLKEAEGEDILSFVEDKGVESLITIDYKNIQMSSDDIEKDVTLTTPEEAESLPEFIALRKRTTGDKLKLTDKGVILTEKLAKGLEVNIGDEVLIKEDNVTVGEVKVIGITENYSGHYAYISPELYQDIFESTPEYKSILIKVNNSDEKSEDKLSKELLEEDSIASITFITSMSETFDNMIDSLNYVIIVLIISAGALAFIVLYNLTNINVSERLREIATIKVLGFYDKEVSAYVYRENLVLSVVGTLFGLVLGIFLHQFVIVTSETEYVMFGREIMPVSYVYAAVLTMVFAVVVNYVMFYKLKRIKMVESLKSVD